MKRLLPLIVRSQWATWLARIALLSLAGSMTWVVTRTEYNFAHWIPHDFLRLIGIPYSYMLSAEENADIFLHFFGAFILTILVHLANLPILRKTTLYTFILIVTLCFGAEIAQFLIGRGIETSDLLLGICGSFVAYLMIENKR